MYAHGGVWLVWRGPTRWMNTECKHFQTDTGQNERGKSLRWGRSIRLNLHPWASAGLTKCFEFRVKLRVAEGRHGGGYSTIQYVQRTVSIQMCSLCKVSALKQRHLYAVTTALLYVRKRYIMSGRHSWTAASVVSEAHVGDWLKRSWVFDSYFSHFWRQTGWSVCIGLWWLQCPVLLAAAASEGSFYGRRNDSGHRSGNSGNIQSCEGKCL